VNRGFISIPVVIVILIVSLAGGAAVYYQAQRSKEKIETAAPFSSNTSAGEQSATSSVVSLALRTRNQSQAAQKLPPESPGHRIDAISDMQQQFAVLEGEIQNAQEKKIFFSPEHAARILSDLTTIEAQGYAKSDVERLRQRVYELSPHLQDQTKQNQSSPQAYMSAAQSNCKSNPSPIFTNDITDMSRVNYIGPPPTMGAGPSLKTHGYIGTDHVRVPLYAPAAMTLESGSHYIGGPYMMEFRVSCEVRVRFGHVTEPAEEIKKLLPSEPKQDSRTQELTPITFAAGDLVGYTTGTDLAGNWDFGVYNSVVRNRYADDPNWSESTTYTTAVCPFDYFTEKLKPVYFAKFNPAMLGGNPPHGESFCKM